MEATSETERTKWIPLYFRAGTHTDVSIERRGPRYVFTNVDLGGVWLSNRPTSSQYCDGNGVFQVMVLISIRDIFYGHEVLELGQDSREFVFPAEFVNDPNHCRIEPLDDSKSLDLTSAVVDWFDEYPPGEPETAFRLLGS